MFIYVGLGQISILLFVVILVILLNQWFDTVLSCNICVTVQLHRIIHHLHFPVPCIPAASVRVPSQCTMPHCSTVSLWVMMQFWPLFSSGLVSVC